MDSIRLWRSYGPYYDSQKSFVLRHGRTGKSNIVYLDSYFQIFISTHVMLQWKSRGGEYMDLSNILLDEINASKTVISDSDESDGRSMKERLDLEKEDDPFWS